MRPIQGGKEMTDNQRAHSEDRHEENQKNAMEIIETLKQNEDVARFVEEIEENNKWTVRVYISEQRTKNAQ